jgi:hypothetical protein
VSASAPRWLRLARDGDTITGYDSADGTHWTLAGTATLPGLTSTVQAGLFAAGTSIESYPADFRAAGVPDNFGAMATGVFSRIRLSWPATGWTGTNVGGAGPNGNGTPLPGTLRPRASTITVAGDGDISPAAGNTLRG